MPPRSSAVQAIPWPVLIAGAWLATVLVIAVLLYSIAKAAINKTEARDIPRLAPGLMQVLANLTRPLTRTYGSQADPPMVATQDSPTVDPTGGRE